LFDDDADVLFSGQSINQQLSVRLTCVMVLGLKDLFGLSTAISNPPSAQSSQSGGRCNSPRPITLNAAGKKKKRKPLLPLESRRFGEHSLSQASGRLGER